MPDAIIVLLSVALLSLLAAIGITRGKNLETPLRILQIFGYFWLFTFAQLALVALVYFLRQHNYF
jgi:hypothetical protein